MSENITFRSRISKDSDLFIYSGLTIAGIVFLYLDGFFRYLSNTWSLYGGFKFGTYSNSYFDCMPAEAVIVTVILVFGLALRWITILKSKELSPSKIKRGVLICLLTNIVSVAIVVVSCLIYAGKNHADGWALKNNKGLYHTNFSGFGLFFWLELAVLILAVVLCILNLKGKHICKIREKEIEKVSAAAPADLYSQADEIGKFKELLDSGIITEEEFEAKKRKLLGLD